MKISRALLGGMFAATTLTGPAVAQTPTASTPSASKPVSPEASKSPAAPASAAAQPESKPKP